MWKKIIVACFAFIGTFSVGAAYYHMDMNATTSAYAVGGTVTGRLGPGFDRDFEFQKGDKILTGIQNPDPDNANFVSWLILKKEKYTDYGCTDWSQPCNKKDAVTGYYALTTESLGSTYVGLAESDFKDYPYYITNANQHWEQIGIKNYGRSNLYMNHVVPFNASLQSSSKDFEIVADRNLTSLHMYTKRSPNDSAALLGGSARDYARAFNAVFETFQNEADLGRNAFLVFTSYFNCAKESLTPPYDLELSKKDYSFDQPYFGDTMWNDGQHGRHTNQFVNTNGVIDYIQSGGIAVNNDWLAAVRLSVNLNLEDVVFAISQSHSGTNTKTNGIAKVTEPSLDSDYTNLSRDAVGDPMKVRLKKIGSMGTINFQSIADNKGTPIAKTSKDAIIYFDAEAQAGSDGSGGVNTVSALVLDDKGTLMYYKPLEPAKGSGLYEFDTTGIPVGKYKIGIVNEVYNEHSTAPADCSASSSVLPLEITVPLSNLAFTATPSLEYGRNVNTGDAVGTVSSQNGVGTPQYTLIDDTAHPGDVNHFELDSDGITVIVKGNALDAGTYHFKIQAQDANGDPAVPLEIAATVTVAKADPVLKFATATPINQVVGNPAFTESFTHQNTDVSDPDFALTYSSSLPAVASVDAPGGNSDTDIEITPGATNGSAIIKVELAETKNFKAADAALTVNVHPRISLSFTPDKNTFATSDVASSGTKIGSVTLTGNSPQYEYSLAIDPDDSAAGADNASFKVKSTGKTGSTAMELLTNTANLPQGTYQITIKAEDAYGQTAYAKGTVTVSGIAQTGFEFYDYTNVNHKLTNGTLTIYYGEANAELVAKGGQSTGLTYELDDPDLSVIDIHPNDGAITVKKTGKVRVKATKPANGTYSEAVIHMEVEVKPCEQVIAFDDPQDIRISYDETNGNTIQEAAQGAIKAGMPHAGNAGAGPISYTLGGTDAGIAGISPSGLLTIHANQNITSAKTFTITARLNDSASSGYDANYGTTSVTKTVYVYPPGSITWTQTSKPQADQTTGSERIGDLSVSGGSGTASYAISTSGDADNLDHAFFTIGSASGEVTLNKAITANDLIAKAYNTTEQGYELHVMVDVTDGGTTATEHLTIYIKGAKRTNLDFKNRDSITREITETYDVNKRFQIQLNQSIAGTTCRISTSPSHPSPADVITLDAGGNAAVLNANEARIDGGTTDPVYVEAVVPAVNGYEETTVEAPVRIKRAEQSLTFSQDPINTSADVRSLNVSISGHRDTKALIYSSSDTTIDVAADGSDPDQLIIRPNSRVINGVVVTALAQGDRNYKDTRKTATLNIAPAGTNQFTAIFPKMTYGDAGPFQVTITPAGTNGETYTYTVADQAIVDIDAGGTITPHHAGTTTVEVTQTSAGGTVGPYTFTIIVHPKPITVTIEDEEIYTGMDIPTFTASIPSADLVTGDTIPQPEFQCVDDQGAAVNAATKPGVYPITGTYSTPPNDYTIRIENGRLTILQDSASSSWYELRNSHGALTASTVWHRDPVDVVLKSANAGAGAYDQIGNEPTFANAASNPTSFTVTEEGETAQNIYFRIDPNGGAPNKGAVTGPIQETIRIDQTAPVIKSITGTDTTGSRTRQLLNTLTLGQYFKPGIKVSIDAEDPRGGTAVIKVSEIESVTYTVTELDQAGNVIGTPITGTGTELTIPATGTYNVCAVATDHAGNESSQKCEAFEVKKLDVDVDGDGKPDFNDIDKDGCADFNILYKDEATGEWNSLNVDANRDGIPEMNIDSDGDGEPDINVDTDGDGKPDLNLIIMSKELWKPTQCVTQHGEQYESVMTLTPQINVDLYGEAPNTPPDGIPDINIDNTGDFKPHLNISANGKDASVNIVKMHDWKPDSNYTVSKFSYDSLGKETSPKPELNIDTDGDGYPDLNLDLDGDGAPDLNIDGNGDGIPDVNIDTTGDGNPNYNIDVSGNGHAEENIIKLDRWKPEKNASSPFPYDTMEIEEKKELEDQGIKVEKPDGAFLPNFAIKVQDVTDTKKAGLQKEVSDFIGDQEVKAVYDIKLLKDNTEITPDGTIRLKVPVPTGIKHPKLLVQKSNGTYEEVSAKLEDGYLVYETAELGIVSVIGDVETQVVDPPTKETPKPQNPGTSVQGSYTNGNGIGGANTGDHTSMTCLTLSLVGSILTVILYMKKISDRRREI